MADGPSAIIKRPKVLVVETDLSNLNVPPMRDDISRVAEAYLNQQPDLSRRSLLKGVLAGATLVTVVPVFNAATGLFEEQEVYADKLKLSVDYPEEFMLFRIKTGKVLLPKVDNKTGGVIVGDKAKVKFVSSKSKKWLGRNPSTPKGVLYFVGKLREPGSEITQSDVPNRELAKNVIDSRGHFLDMDPAEFGLEFSDDVYPFVFEPPVPRKRHDDDNSTHVSNLAFAVGFSNSERGVVSEIATLQREHRATVYSSHDILVAHTSPSFEAVKTGERPISFYLERIKTRLACKKVKGGGANRTDSSMHSRLSVNSMLPPPYMGFMLEKGASTESKPISEFGVHEERYLYKKVENTATEKIRTFFNLSFWVFMEETSDGPKPSMKCRLILDGDPGFTDEDLEKRFPFATEQEEISFHTYMNGKASYVKDAKRRGELAKINWNDPRNVLAAVYGSHTISNPLISGDDGKVLINPRMIGFDPKHKNGSRTKSVSIASSKYDPEVAKDNEHRFCFDQSNGQISTRSKTSPFTIVLDKDGRLVFRAGAKIHIAGYGFVDLPVNAPSEAVTEMFKFYDSLGEEDPKDKKKKGWNSSYASREAVRCLVSGLKQLEGAGNPKLEGAKNSKKETCVPTDLGDFFKGYEYRETNPRGK